MAESTRSPPVLKRLAAASHESADLALLVVRLWLGLTLAVAHGWGKVIDLANFTDNVAAKAIPLASVLGPAAALSELVGGILVAAGWLTRGAAGFVLATMLVAGLHVHAADPFAKKELALSYAAMALALVLAGPGRLSIDHRIFAGRGRSGR